LIFQKFSDTYFNIVEYQLFSEIRKIK